MKLFARRPSPAVVMSMVAMVIAIGGSAIAAKGGNGGQKTGKIVGYAFVNDNGTVTKNLSLNVRSGNVTVENDVFCFRNLPFKFKGLQAEIDYKNSTSATSTTQVVKGTFSCNSKAQAEVQTFYGDGSNDPEPVFVQFYK